MPDYSSIAGRRRLYEQLTKVDVQSLTLELVGRGVFGDVSASYQPPLAVKMGLVGSESAISEFLEEEGKLPTTLEAYQQRDAAWSELFVIMELINPLVLDGICPNLLLTYQAWPGMDCLLDRQTAEGEPFRKAPCSNIVMELASQSLTTWLAVERTREQLENALFQIMAGLHTIHYHHQLSHGDVGSKNILVFDVQPGGYWRYTIMGVEHQLANLGFVMVLADFGVSQWLSPVTNIWTNGKASLGNRDLILDDGGVLLNQPIDTALASENMVLMSSHTQFFCQRPGSGPQGNDETICGRNLKLSKHADGLITDFYDSSRPVDGHYLAPEWLADSRLNMPRELSLDVQDAFRIFTGGAGVNQPGNHPKPATPVDWLDDYLLPERVYYTSINHTTTELPMINAGFFINSFFQLAAGHSTEKPIEHYQIS